MNDRGMIKWAPFNSLINGKAFIKEIEHNKKKIPKPILSSDQLENLNEKIFESFNTKSLTQIKYYQEGYILNVVGIINHINYSYKYAFINNIKIHFSQIIDINF